MSALQAHRLWALVLAGALLGTLSIGTCAVAVAVAGEAGARSNLLKRAKAELQDSGPKIRPRIIGGTSAGDTEIPWQAAIVRRREKSGDRPAIKCGAAFVRPTILITAAHCIDGALFGGMKDYEVLNGAADLAGSGMRRYDITDVVGHPQYDKSTTDYDFALLRVAQAYSGPLLELLTAEENNALNVGTTAQASGWGVTGSGDTAQTLQKVDVTIVRRSLCNAGEAYGGRISQRMLCAGFADGGKDACQGDSGGPLTTMTGSGATRLVGVASWGEGCATPNKYGVYGRLFAVRDWVMESIALLERGVPKTSGGGERILNGEPVPVGEIPWQAAILAKAKSPGGKINDRVRCGASFIRSDLLLTAAHCVEGLVYGNSGRFVVLNGKGAVDLNDPKMAEFEITDVLAHPRYDRKTFDYDFALLRVSRSYDGEQLALVSAETVVEPGAVARVSGWGLNEKDEISSILQKLDVGVIDTKGCNSKESYGGLITDRMLCAGFQEGLKDSCKGDSGGPLTTVLPNKSIRLIGVVSWGQECGRKDKYGVYGRITSVRDWIDGATRVLDKTE